MNTRRARCLTVLASAAIVLFGSFSVAADPVAQLGSVFADTYSAFAPLFSFYQSYADHLFQGTPVEIPHDVPGACDGFSEALAYLHLEIQAQTASEAALSMPVLIHLRSDAAGFCATFGPTLQEIDAWIDVDLERLGRASEDGLFVWISELNDGLDLLFNEVFDGLPTEEARWRFAVTFAVRAILVSETLERLNANLREIFYGAAEAEAPPLPVSEVVSEAMGVLIALSAQDLAAEEADSARAAAEIIYRGFMGIAQRAPTDPA